MFIRASVLKEALMNQTPRFLSRPVPAQFHRKTGPVSRLHLCLHLHQPKTTRRGRHAAPPSKSPRHQSIRWSSPSNDKASFDDSRDSQGASKSSWLPKTCPSYDDANSNRQNLCVTPLVALTRLSAAASRSTPSASFTTPPWIVSFGKRRIEAGARSARVGDLVEQSIEVVVKAPWPSPTDFHKARQDDGGIGAGIADLARDLDSRDKGWIPPARCPAARRLANPLRS